jgi:hypothetical protein
VKGEEQVLSAVALHLSGSFRDFPSRKQITEKAAPKIMKTKKTLTQHP